VKTKLNIYSAVGSDGYEICQAIDSESGGPNAQRLRREIDGEPKLPSWKPVAVKIFRDDGAGRYNLRYSDSPWGGTSELIFRETVLEKLGELLLEYGELLPLECEEAKLWVYNPTRILDVNEALDMEASEIVYLEDGETMGVVSWAVFRAEAVSDVDIFKLSVERRGPTYFSQRFVDLWEMSGLQGLDFLQNNDIDPSLRYLKSEQFSTGKKRKKAGSWLNPPA